MTKSLLIKRISIIFILSLIVVIYLMAQKCSGKQDLSTISILDDKQENPFLIQESLVADFDSIKRIVYLGYTKNMNDTSKRNDILKIYHIKGNDTILRNEITFIRLKFEQKILLMDKSEIPDETVNKNSFIIYTAISSNSFFSENTFTFNRQMNKYEFIKRVNFMYYFKPDTLALKTVFFIKNKIDIDSTEMNSIFRTEYDLYCGKYPDYSQWILTKGSSQNRRGKLHN